MAQTISFPGKFQAGSYIGKGSCMIAEKELETTQNKERLAEDIRQALIAEMRKAIAEQKWERLSSVITLMRSSF